MDGGTDSGMDSDIADGLDHQWPGSHVLD